MRQDALLIQMHFVALFHPKPNACLHFDLESCNSLMCTYTVVTHPCHIPRLAQARPMMLCIYTSYVVFSTCFNVPRFHCCRAALPEEGSGGKGGRNLQTVHRHVDQFSLTCEQRRARIASIVSRSYHASQSMDNIVHVGG